MSKKTVEAPKRNVSLAAPDLSVARKANEDQRLTGGVYAVYELRIVGNCAGEYVENVLYFRNIGTDNGNPYLDCADLVQAFHDTIEPLFLACLSQSYVLYGYYCKQVNPGVTASIQQPVGPGVKGTILYAVTTSSQGVIILSSYQNADNKFETAKIYLAGCPGARVNENKISDLYQTALNALCNQLQTLFGSEPRSWGYCGFDKETKTGWGPTLIQFSQTIGTIRSRGRAGGRGHRRA